MKGILLQYALPTVFIAIFYVILTMLGNRTLCVSKLTTGIPCPGCGMTRAYLSLFRGDVSSALYNHPLFILPFIAFLVVVLKSNRLISKIYHHPFFWWTLLGVFIAVWLIRMFFLFPHAEPLDYNHQSLFAQLFQALKRIREIIS